MLDKCNSKWGMSSLFCNIKKHFSDISFGESQKRQYCSGRTRPSAAVCGLMLCLRLRQHEHPPPPLPLLQGCLLAGLRGPGHATAQSLTNGVLIDQGDGLFRGQHEAVLLHGHKLLLHIKVAGELQVPIAAIKGPGCSAWHEQHCNSTSGWPISPCSLSKMMGGSRAAFACRWELSELQLQCKRHR